MCWNWATDKIPWFKILLAKSKTFEKGSQRCDASSYSCLSLPDQTQIVLLLWNAVCQASRHPAFSSVLSIETKQCQWTPQEHINDQGNHGSARSSLPSLGCPNNPSICRHRERHLVLSHSDSEEDQTLKRKKRDTSAQECASFFFVMSTAISWPLPKDICIHPTSVHNRFLPQVEFIIMTISCTVSFSYVPATDDTEAAGLDRCACDLWRNLPEILWDSLQRVGSDRAVCGMWILTWGIHVEIIMFLTFTEFRFLNTSMWASFEFP